MTPRSIERRLVRVMRLAAACAIVIAALAVALVARGQSGPRIPMLIATALGIGLTVLLGTAVMSVIFPSTGRGNEADAGAAPLEREEK